MKAVFRTCVVAALCALALVAGCNPSSDDSSHLRTDAQSVFGRPSPTFEPSVGSSSAQQDLLSISLATFAGPDHRDQAQLFLNDLAAGSGWKSLFLYSSPQAPDSTVVMHGRYPTLAAAQKDLVKVKAYSDVLAKAMIVSLEVADVGPDEWNLENANGYYTVVVAVFNDTAKASGTQRKELAVLYAKHLRQRGEQAFFQHAPGKSNVTVGCWGKNAVVEVKDKKGMRVEIREPAIHATVKRYPKLAVDGYESKYRTPGGEWKTAPSYPVKIPRSEKTQEPQVRERLQIDPSFYP